MIVWVLDVVLVWLFFVYIEILCDMLGWFCVEVLVLVLWCWDVECVVVCVDEFFV